VVIEVAAVTAGEIVDYADGEAVGEQRVHHVAADESGTTGDNRNGLASHARVSR
jgi:hypothetical protein